MFNFLIISLLCIASLCVSAQTNVLYQDFSTASGTTAPPGWSFRIVSGNSQVDSFRFDQKTYFPAPGIKGNHAFFDVYNGASTGGSNGDGFAEEVHLITPFVSLDTSRDWTLAFDYHLLRIRTPVFSVLWRPDTQTSWSSLWSDNVGSSLTLHKEIKVIPGSVVRGKGQFAFSWKTSNNGANQGYLAIDNVRIYARAASDVGVRPSGLNRKVYCEHDSANAVFEVTNQGLNDLNLVPLIVKVSYPLKDTMFRDTMHSLRINEQKAYNVSDKFRFRPGYMYAITVNAALNQDTIRSNDTARTSILFLDTLQRPAVADADRCGSGSLDLYSLTHLNDTTFWFDKNNHLLGKGKVFTTPVIETSDTFYARAAKIFPDKLNTYQGPYWFNSTSSGGAYIQVVARQHLIIHSIGQHFIESGTFDADIFYKRGTYKGYEYDSTSWSMIASLSDEADGWGSYKKIPVDLVEMNRGDTVSFFLSITANASPTYKRGAVKVNVPAMDVLSDEVTNKRFVSGGTLYKDLSWDGEIQYWTICMSEADTIAVQIISRPKGVKVSANATFNGLFRKGTLKEPDQVSQYGQVAYDISSPTGTSGSSYGVKWGIGAVKVTTMGGWIVPDTFYYTVPPMFGNDFLFVLNPKGLMIDSTIRLSFTVFNYINGCDTMIERYIHVSVLPEPWFVFNTVCEGGQLVLSNKTFNAEAHTFKWEFGDGTKATGKDAVKVYDLPGNYTIRLTATNASGISASVNRQVTVYEKPKPQIDAQFACEGDPIHLTANRIKPGEKITWIIDNRTIADSLSLRYIYNQPGSFNVLLVASNSGCADTVSRNVFQFHRPVADFQAQGRCSYDSFTLTSNVQYDGQGSLGYKWLVDQKVLSTLRNWKGIMPAKGALPVRLIVASQFQCSDTIEKVVNVLPSPVADFDVGLACFDVETRFFNKTRDTTGLNVKYQWSFGDGRFSTELNPVNNYQNTGEMLVALRATANNGCSNRKDSLVIVKLRPNANFTFNGGCDGEGVVFTNYSDQSDGFLKYEWDFADGYTSDLHSPVHTFRVQKTTTFNVSLKVYSDNQSCSDVHTEQVTIAVNPSCEFQAIRSEYDRTVWKFIPEQIDSQSHFYTWIFVSSGASTNASPVHRFEYSETKYRIILDVENFEGCHCSDSSTVINTSWGVSVENLSSKGIKVYPNPVSDNLHIVFNKEVMGIPDQIILTDILGKEVYNSHLSGDLAAYSVNLSSYKEGTYFLTCLNHDGYTFTIPVLVGR